MIWYYSNKDNESRWSKIENDYVKKTRHKHGKPVNGSHHSHPNSCTDSDNTYGVTAYDSTKHHVQNDDFKLIYQTTVSSL